MNQFEYILLLRKGKDRKVNNCGVSDVLSYPNAKDKRYDGTNLHDSQKPIALFEMSGYRAFEVLGISVTSRLWAKAISSVIIVIANYFISKLIVFKKKF